MTTVREGLRELTMHLQRDYIPDAGKEARLLLGHVLGLPSHRLRLHEADPLDQKKLMHAMDLAGRRGVGEPMSHLLGSRCFYGRDFLVNRTVLDPRPETECLIAEALKEDFSDLLDLGTGSGAIAITLLAERLDAVGLATDVSELALGVAQHNAQVHGVAERLGTEQSDWFDAVGGIFDLIVSNPPYIAAEEMNELQNTVIEYEPRIALTDEADGLSAYRKITSGAPDHLRPAGRLIVEIGPTQAQAVAAMMAAAGFEGISVIPDLDGRDRVVVGYLPQAGV
ncbi:peptide chain release factor N(5)-glutamine methyltransferase [Cognatiyoonia sp. IB215446]|uniref:peptide chain release factor N(5)-glutamine methyltransferase n=1 Tax=Cognatiyoonia sp. IB215446 TaxID=3097355 RepID=UPI002A109544|nr:peptide chain release factor N(5)-glutamine methyltransferase [Cognatiyoonia sp. IB215446]MDX8349763.1 peptide chain release factor N(5)-glutamine methyltransferase [Cognatiyoonia sp. IB215446]